MQIGISGCLLGQKVRFDGGHKQLRMAANHWSNYFQFVSHCPEMAIGMPSPRPAIRVVDTADGERLLDSKDPTIDHSQTMRSHAAAYAQAHPELSGYILASKSPSCGMERLKVYNETGGTSRRDGVGFFVQELQRIYPDLPMEEDGRLADRDLRENFLTRVYIYHALQQLQAGGLSAAKIVEFHSSIKLLLMAHNVGGYRELGRLVANLKQQPIEVFFERYRHGVMTTLKCIATRKKHTNVLQHIQGYFKKRLDGNEKQELVSVIMRYNAGYLPLQAPLTLLHHYLQKHPDSYLQSQRYFNPYPEAMAAVA